MPALKDTLRALLHDILEEAEREGIREPWHSIREIEGQVWEARTRTERPKAG